MNEDGNRSGAGGWCAPHETTFEDGPRPVRRRPAGGTKAPAEFDRAWFGVPADGFDPRRYRVEYDAYGEGCLVLWCVDHGSVCTWPGAALVRELTSRVAAHEKERHTDG